MKTASTWNVEHFVPILITGGFFVHLISVARHFASSDAKVSEVLLWPVDLCLALIMAYSALALVVRRRAFFGRFNLGSPLRRFGYWAIATYIIISLPGHAVFLSTGNTDFFEGFPWWFSLAIMPVYVIIIAYFITLRPGDEYSNQRREAVEMPEGAIDGQV